MLSEVQQQKLTALFRALDADGNGRMEASDLDRVVEELAASRGWAPGSDRAEGFRATYAALWQHVQPWVVDGGLPRDGFIAFHDVLLNTPGAYDQAIRGLGEYIFDALDADEDGRITVEEQRRFYQVYGVDPDLADAVFPRWDRDGNGYVSKQEMGEVVRQFFFSTDPEAPENWLFGPFDSPLELRPPLDV